MKRWPSTVTLGVLAGILVPVLSGCSLFRSSSESTQPVPVTSTSAGAAALGSPSVRTSAAPSASVAPPSPTSSPTRAPDVPTVPGYALAKPLPQVERKFQTVAGQFRGVFSGLTSRTVVKGSQQVGSLVLLGLTPELVGNTQVEQRLVPGMVKGMTGQGAVVKTQNVGGQKVAVATTKSTNIVAWYRAGTVVLVLGNGTDPAQSLTFAKAYLAVR